MAAFANDRLVTAGSFRLTEYAYRARLRNNATYLLPSQSNRSDQSGYLIDFVGERDGARTRDLLIKSSFFDASSTH